MKNPLEFSLLEIERIMSDDPEPDNLAIVQRAYSDLVTYLHYRLNWMKNYQAQETARIVQHKEPTALPRRTLKALDDELLDNAEIVTEGFSPSNSQAYTGDKYDTLIRNLGG